MTYSKREFQRNYDLSFWVSCSFETALAIVVARAQEGLTPAEKVKAYRTIYCPAQEIHLQSRECQSGFVPSPSASRRAKSIEEVLGWLVR